MKDDRIDSALRRIAGAVERIEKLGAQGRAKQDRDTEAERRYHALRAETGAALHQLDDLIARMGG